MIQKHSNIKFWILVIVLSLSAACNTIKAQENEKNRLNLEFGTGISNFKDNYGYSPNAAISIALSIWTPLKNIYSLDAFFNGYTDYYSDISIFYGKILYSKKGEKRFASIHGGIGYINIHRQTNKIEFDKKALGATAQVKGGWAFDKGWLGFTIYANQGLKKI
jgi:hypothetical protein